MGLVVVTGAAGAVGTVLRAGLAGGDTRLRLVDVRPVEGADADDEVVTADLRDLDATVAALDGADAVVHLAANPREASFERILDENVRTTYHVFEAARRTGVRRVVFASSAHVTGFYPWGAPVGPSDPVRPDTYYAVSKAFGENLGRLYADKHGLEVVCVRVGGFADAPRWPGFVWIWLSHRDAVDLFRRCLETPGVGYLVVYGVSANTRRWWRDDGWDVLGYAPVDDGEAYAHRFGDGPGAPVPPHALQGAEFTERASGAHGAR